MVVKKGKYYQLIFNILLFALGNIGSKFIVFILMPLYTNELTTTEYGISELVITGTNLLIPFASISIQDATLRFALDKKNNSGEVLKNTTFILALGSILTCLLFPLIKLYGAIADWSVYFLAISIVYMIRNAFSIYLKAIGKTKLYALDSILYTMLLMITSILFLTVFKMGLKGYFLAIIISTSASIVILSVFGDVIHCCSTSSINKNLMKEMVSFSLPMILNNVSWWIINSLDKVMVEYFVSVAASGIYSVASKIPSVLTTLTNIFNQAWIISSVSEYDTTKEGNFYSKTFAVFSCILIIFASGIVLIIKSFMQIYVGDSFVESWQYVPILLLGSIFQSYATFFGAIYTSAKKNVSVMTTTLLAAGINFILNIILIPQIGVQGAVIATAISYFTVFAFRMLDSQRYMKFHINYKKLIASLVILTCQSVLMITDANENSYIESIFCFTLLLIINFNTFKELIIMINNKMIHKK